MDVRRSQARLRPRLAFACAGAAILVALPALSEVRAWYVSPAEVAQKAQLVAVATILSARVIPYPLAAPGDPPTPLLTEYEVQVDAVWKGNEALAGKRFTFRQVGGTLDGITTAGEPHPDYAPGQRWVLALVRVPQGWWTTWGIRHGAFRVEKGEAVRDFTGFVFVDGDRRGPRPPERFTLRALETMMRGK